MTHDELLAEINLASRGEYASLAVALIAVVEIHKPKLNENDNQMFCVYCSSFSYRYVEYPCPEIQAIEKELK